MIHAGHLHFNNGRYIQTTVQTPQYATHFHNYSSSSNLESNTRSRVFQMRFQSARTIVLN